MLAVVDLEARLDAVFSTGKWFVAEQGTVIAVVYGCDDRSE